MTRKQLPPAERHNWRSSDHWLSYRTKGTLSKNQVRRKPSFRN